MERYSNRLPIKVFKESLKFGGGEDDLSSYTRKDPTGSPSFDKGGHLQRSIKHSPQHARRFNKNRLPNWDDRMHEIEAT